jgi:plasmid rolling circle replication initiator protein Rep
MFTNFVLEDQQIIKRKVTLFKSHVMKNIKKWKFGFLLDLSGKEMRDDGNTTNVARCLVWECVRKVVLIGYTEGKIYELHKNRTLFSQP